jgi:FlaA1/EpsC-like NDP-sugar epimerase
LACPSDIRRFFVSPEESGEICLLAAILGKSGQIFFPKFDIDKDQSFFIDILERFLKAYGKQPLYFSSDGEALTYAANMRGNENEYPVYRFPSETSGEKSYEEFYSDDEKIFLDHFEGLGIIQPEIPQKERIVESILNLESIFDGNIPSKQEIVACLKDLLPDFQHIETGKSLDQKI